MLLRCVFVHTILKEKTEIKWGKVRVEIVKDDNKELTI